MASETTRAKPGTSILSLKEDSETNRSSADRGNLARHVAYLGFRARIGDLSLRFPQESAEQMHRVLHTVLEFAQLQFCCTDCLILLRTSRTGVADHRDFLLAGVSLETICFGRPLSGEL
jgi:hypothetical protein